jgi:hypothetical protein
VYVSTSLGIPLFQELTQTPQQQSKYRMFYSHFRHK